MCYERKGLSADKSIKIITYGAMKKAHYNK